MDTIRVGEVANLLGVSPSTVIRMADRGDLPMVEGGGEGEHRRFRRQDILEYRAATLQAAAQEPARRLDAAILSTIPTDTTRALQTALLTGWAAARNYAIVATVSSLDEALQLVWDAAVQAVVVEDFTAIASKDARNLFRAVCTLTGVQIVESHTEAPQVDLAAESLRLTGDVLSDMLTPVLGPAEAGRIVEFNLQQWRRLLDQQRDGNGHDQLKRPTASPSTRRPLPTRPARP